MTTIAFAGPSIFGLDRTRWADGVEFRPPAACGDLYAAIGDGPSAILLIDGVFSQVTAIWHKEILLALSRGIPVCGASSMGALRAAECESFGMTGIGRVFDDYRSGRRNADSDVALAHGPAELGWQPLTVALVDAEEAIADLAEQAIADDAEIRLLIDAARAVHFSRRSWRAVFDATPISSLRAAELRQAIRERAISVKRDDAALALDHVVQHGMATPDTSRFRFAHTLYFATLEAEVAARHG